ncbi:MAG TPA: tetratricopeptide repeat protein, partial [Kofleriaceae bacterium]|nr:tetratricopeptide repeat protein [Kofleriaceae bacterium]
MCVEPWYRTGMPFRVCAAVIVVIGCLAAPAHADPRADITAKTRAAMASYDAMDYDAARRQLNQALAIAKRAKLDRDPIVARVYLDLGIAQLASSDQEAAKVAFLSAVQIDPKITIDPAYKSTELVRMLDDARAAATDTSEPAGDDCKSRGIQIAALDGARRGVAQPVEVVIGGDVAPSRVVVMYRPEGALDFTEAKLTRKAG